MRMKMDITTGRLPMQFLIIGWVLIGVGIYQLILGDPIGIIFIPLILISFFKSGISIDFKRNRLKEYVGGRFLRIGKWKSIEGAQSLEIKKSSWSQEYNVSTISTVTTVSTSSLYLKLPDKKIMLLQAKKKRVLKKAEKIAALLHIPIENNNP